MIDVVIFSKNRPLQLYSLLESLHRYTDVHKSAKVTVIHRYEEDFSDSIEEIEETFKNVVFCDQQVYKFENHPEMCICSTRSSIVNLPLNRVQDEYKNRCGEETPEKMLEMWKSGKKINIDPIDNINNPSAHYPIDVILKDRI